MLNIKVLQLNQSNICQNGYSAGIVTWKIKSFPTPFLNYFTHPSPSCNYTPDPVKHPWWKFFCEKASSYMFNKVVNTLILTNILIIWNWDNSWSTYCFHNPEDVDLSLKVMSNDRLRVSKVSWKFRISTFYNFAVIYPWNFPFS